MRAESSLIVKHAELVGSSGIMEDRIFIGNKSVVVLDGATQADQTIEQTGGWMADQIGQRFSCYIETTDDEVELAELLAQAIADTRDEFNLVPGRSPSTTVCAARFSSQGVDLLVLGDSPALTKSSKASGVEVLQDRRLRNITKTLTRPVIPQDDCGEWREYYRCLSDLRNTSCGFWIAEADPEAAMHAKILTVNPGAGIVLCTDGVSAIVASYELVSWNYLFEAARQPDGLISQLVAVENGDQERTQYPRSKVSDDKLVASAILNSIPPN